MRIIISGIVGTGVGFVLGWLVCAMLSGGKAEDAYAEGYRQAVRDKEDKQS